MTHFALLAAAACGGKKPAEYKGVAAFFNYLTNAEVQAKSHQMSGYLPITMAALQLTEKAVESRLTRVRLKLKSETLNGLKDEQAD